MGAHSGRASNSSGIGIGQIEQPATSFGEIFARSVKCLQFGTSEQQRWNPDHEAIKQLANIESIMGANPLDARRMPRSVLYPLG